MDIRKFVSKKRRLGQNDEGSVSDLVSVDATANADIAEPQSGVSSSTRLMAQPDVSNRLDHHINDDLPSDALLIESQVDENNQTVAPIQHVDVSIFSYSSVGLILK